MPTTCKLFSPRMTELETNREGPRGSRSPGYLVPPPPSTSCTEKHAPLVEGSNPHSHLHRSHSFARSASGSKTGWEMNARRLILFAVVSCEDGDNCNDEGVPLCSRTVSQRDAHDGVACAHGKRCWRPRRVSNATNSGSSDMVLSSLDARTRDSRTTATGGRIAEPSRAEPSAASCACATRSRAIHSKVVESAGVIRDC